VAHSSGYLSCAIIKHVAIGLDFQVLMLKKHENIDLKRVMVGLVYDQI
jgi:hypothetical protein